MSWSDNFPIYIYNLSPVYVFSVVISVIALIVTVFYHKFDVFASADLHPSEIEYEDDLQDEQSPLVSGEFGGVVGKIKAAKQKALLKHLHGDGYNDEQNELEKRTEAQQLEAIWDLLREQEDKFMLNSKTEMQEQLRLYRS